MLPRAAVLCVSPSSAWHSLAVDAYTARRDARTFGGGLPVIAHPPCRSWSRACRHQAKPEPGERELGLWCLDQVVRWGGVVEQPAGSALFDALPPGGTVQWVAQAWWGTRTLKPTWLWWHGVQVPEVPFRLIAQTACDRRVWQRMSRGQRSATPLAMCRWLLDAVAPALCVARGVPCTT